MTTSPLSPTPVAPRELLPHATDRLLGLIMGELFETFEEARVAWTSLRNWQVEGRTEEDDSESAVDLYVALASLHAKCDSALRQLETLDDLLPDDDDADEADSLEPVREAGKEE